MGPGMGLGVGLVVDEGMIICETFVDPPPPSCFPPNRLHPLMMPLISAQSGCIKEKGVSTDVCVEGSHHEEEEEVHFTMMGGGGLM